MLSIAPLALVLLELWGLPITGWVLRGEQGRVQEDLVNYRKN